MTHLLRSLLFLSITCGVARAAVDWPMLRFTPVATGASQPVHIASARDGTNRLFVVQQSGEVLLKSGSGFAATPFLNLSSKVINDGEQGLLSIAFPPDYATAGHFYAFYIRASDGNSVVSRFGLTGNPDVADPASEEEVLSINGVFGNHRGGQLQFGPDGYLYLTIGDGGSGGDPGNRAQDLRSFHGKLLRIDVETDSPTYKIPRGNPFRGSPGVHPEIWAFGFRNPWRFSFDRERGGLYIADVGQDAVEEIDFEPISSRGGRNYGWRIKEGNRNYDLRGATPRRIASLKRPVAVVRHPTAEAIVGGYVYRGALFPRMAGFYFFADFSSGRVWGLTHDRIWRRKQLDQPGNQFSTFGEDDAGEIYLADYSAGTIFHVEDTGAAWQPEAFPAGGTFNRPKRVVLRTSSAGARIHYTQNGIDPKPSDDFVPSGGAVRIVQSGNLKARAIRSDLTASEVLSVNFTIQ